MNGCLATYASWLLPVEFPHTVLEEFSYVQAVFAHPSVKSLLPVPILLAIAPALYWFFKKTWRELDEEALRARTAQTERELFDYRPAVCLAIVAVVLTIQEYYGGRRYYDVVIKPFLETIDPQYGFINLKKWDEYYGYVWWSFTRVAGYVLIPFPLWKLLFRKDSLLDMGLRTKGFFKHAWIYLACLGIIIPVMLLVSQEGDFGNYYPFYKKSSRSWFDFMLWQGAYYAQFLALEMFFRGFMLGALRRTMGSAAIFVMAVPYCMIHYGKPYLEAHGAIVAGVVLGSLAMRTKSIYSGFLLHISVAFLMDFLALYKRAALPTQFWPD